MTPEPVVIEPLDPATIARREEWREQKKREQLSNPDRVRERRREYYHRNRETILAKRRTPEARAYYNELSKQNRNKDWKRWYIRYLLRTFDVTEQEANKLAKINKCAICGKGKLKGPQRHTDHCHKTNKVRGILCEHCNRGIGMFNDNPKSLIKAAEYLSGGSE